MSTSPPSDDVLESIPSDIEDDFEPWSPDFQAAALESEDVASAHLSCIKDGEYKVGKKFYCSRCNVYVYGSEELARHRNNHASSSPVAGPSGMSMSPPSGEDGSVAQVGGADEPPYRIEHTGTRRFARAVAVEKLRFNNQWQGQRLGDLRRQLYRLFEEILVRAREGINDNDILRVVVRHHALNHAVVVPLREAGDMNVETILSKIENVLQSEENLTVDDSFQVIVGALHIPQGAGRLRIAKLTGPDNSIHKKSSMVQIVNGDQLCMARAIGVGLAKHCIILDTEWKELKKKHKYLTNPEILAQERKVSALGFKNIKNKKREEQKQLAILLCQKAGVPTDRPGSLNDLPALEDALRVRIAVMAASLGNKFIRVPDNEHDDWPLIYLYLVDNEGVSHTHTIVSISAFSSTYFFCERCFQQYNDNIRHRCKTTCLTCKNQSCIEMDDQMSCRSCHMTCRSLECFERHKAERTRKMDDQSEVTVSQCDTFWRCTTCKKVINRLKRPIQLHEYSEWLCKCCKSWVIGEHRCFLFPEEPKKPVKKFIFFDFEATQDTLADCEEGYQPKNCCQTPCKECSRCQRCAKSWCGQSRHVSNFVVTQTVCEACENDSLTPGSTCDSCGNRCTKCDGWDKDTQAFSRPPCADTCGYREAIFQGDTTLENFGNWLFDVQHKDATVLAHNMKGYDGVFLLEYLVSHSIRPSKVIYNGSKIMYMEVAKGLNIRVLDSLNFLPMKLAALPKAFGLTELRKGYFPHFLILGKTNSTWVPNPKRMPMEQTTCPQKTEKTSFSGTRDKEALSSIFERK